jgi:hypothetical protein
LVFDWRDSSITDPVVRVGCDLALILHELDVFIDDWRPGSKQLFVLFFRPGREPVVARGKRFAPRVRLLNVGVYLGKPLSSEVLLLKGAIGVAILNDVLDEVFVDAVAGGHASQSGSNQISYLICYYIQTLLKSKWFASTQ